MSNNIQMNRAYEDSTINGVGCKKNRNKKPIVRVL